MNFTFQRPSKKTTKIIIAVVLFLFILSCVIGYGFSIGRGVKSDPNDYVVAVYDGKDIMFSDLRKSAEVIARNAVARGAKITEEARPQIFAMALQNCVMDIEIEKEIDERNIKVKRSEVKAQLENIKKSYPSEEAFDQFLAKNNLSEGDIKDDLKKQLLRKHLQENIAGNVTVTDEEAMKVYNQAKAQSFTTPNGAQILIAVFKDKASADAMKQELAAGKEWDDCLAKHTDSLLQANRQEQKSIMPTRDMKGPIAFVKNMKAGEVSAVTAGPNNSFFLVKKLANVAGGVIPFEQVKPQIVQFIKNQKELAAVNKYFSEKLKDAKVDVKDKSLFQPVQKAKPVQNTNTKAK